MISASQKNPGKIHTFFTPSHGGLVKRWFSGFQLAFRWFLGDFWPFMFRWQHPMENHPGWNFSQENLLKVRFTTNQGTFRLLLHVSSMLHSNYQDWRKWRWTWEWTNFNVEVSAGVHPWDFQRQRIPWDNCIHWRIHAPWVGKKNMSRWKDGSI